MRTRHWPPLVAFSLLLFVSIAYAVTLTDDRGRNISLGHPPERIVSLAPHVTELLYAIDAGDMLVGADEYSDFPEGAVQLPRIGNASRVDIERVLSLEPDLVIGWLTGNADSDIKKLEKLGIPVFVTEITSLDNVADQLIRLGQLIGKPVKAKEVAAGYRHRLQKLRAQYKEKTRISVFYQVWEQPLMTVNGKHFISDAIQLCGGNNVFSELQMLAPTLSKESVIAADPQAIISGRTPGNDSSLRSEWGSWQSMDAVKYDNLFSIPSDLIARPTPRILDGVVKICEALDEARSHMHAR